MCAVLLSILGVVTMRKKPTRGDRKPSAIDEATYELLVRILNGESLPPVSLRSKPEKAALVRLWRAKGQYRVVSENGRDVLYLGARKVVRKSEIERVVLSELRHAETHNARKLNSALKVSYVGISTPKIQTVLNRNRNYSKQLARRPAESVQNPISAKTPQIVHQVALIDMDSSGTVMVNATRQRYILCVMDVYSRFVWLRAVEKKTSRHLLEKIIDIYLEHGYPQVIQCDHLAKSKESVRRFCHKLNIRFALTNCRHLLAESEVNSQNLLRSQADFNVMHRKNEKLTWVERLPSYQNILNNDPKEAIGFKTPFEVYFGRKANSQKAVGGTEAMTDTGVGRNRCSELSDVYMKSDSNKMELISKVDTSTTKNNAEIKIELPDAELEATHEYQLVASLAHTYDFVDQGYRIVYDPPGDGNCQFSALSYHFQQLGIYRSVEMIRRDVAEYLDKHSMDEHGFPLSEYTPGFDSWHDYVFHMAQNQTFGDQQTLRAASHIFDIEIVVVSSLGPGASHVFRPSTPRPAATIFLGHFAENQGIHYVCLVPNNASSLIFNRDPHFQNVIVKQENKVW